MGSASATAMLVGRREMIDARPNGVTAEISRGEIEEALGSDQPLDLILDVLWPVHEGAGSASGTVTVAWDRADLESLLADSESESLTFSFDRDELGRVLDEPEFEGHGLRETALVLTVAAAAAVGASAASGMPMYDDGSGPTTTGVTTLSQTAVAAAPDAFERAVTRSVPADAFERAAARGEASAPDAFDRAVARESAATVGHDEASLADRGIGVQAVGAVHDEASLADRGIEVQAVPAVHDEVALAARGIELQTAPALHDEATLAARGIEAPAAPVGDSGSGFDVPSIDAATAGAVGGGLALAGLLIVGAGFATRRNRARPV